MTTIEAGMKHFKLLNEEIHQAADADLTIEGCMGQRYIASGLSGKRLTITGVPGNALGAYMDGCDILVKGNAQDAVGDTMNDGAITICGSCGDAAGYAVRGGVILIEKNVGYRAGVHMKAYRDKLPALVVGGEAGSFLGEYQAGGYVIVLGLHTEGRAPVGSFCAAGMHGGKQFLRTSVLPADLPSQVQARKAAPADLEEIRPYLTAYCSAFGAELAQILDHDFYVLTPNTSNPYVRLYTTN